MKRSYHDSLLAGSSGFDTSTSIVAQLRRLRPLIERRGTKDQKIAFNVV